MRKIYVSDSGNDKDDGLTAKTPIRSWQRFIQTLCRQRRNHHGERRHREDETHC